LNPDVGWGLITVGGGIIIGDFLLGGPTGEAIPALILIGVITIDDPGQATDVQYD